MHGEGGLCALLLALSTTVPAVAADLVVSRADNSEIARLDVPDGSGWCVLWRHSVQGFEVSDCYENRAGRMVLTHSRTPDFAAGLGHIPGRGRQVSDGQGGYWILDIDEPVPGDSYVLRAGGPQVDHRLQVGETTVSLSAIAPHEALRIFLTKRGDL